MSGQKLELQIRGLYTAPNNLSGVPAGALELATNLVINAKNLIESRRGQTQYGDPLSIGSDQVNKLFNYSSSLIVNYADKMAYDAGAGNWIDYTGTYLAPSSTNKIRSLEALRNFYFTSSRGIFKIDALTSNPRPAGVPRALGGSYELNDTPGFLVDNTAVAYRILWGYIDANDNLILGAPSQRLVAVNDSGDDYDVELTFTIPDTITTEYFYQIYRSNASATAADEPSDELQLVIQGNPTSAEITAKSFTVTDQTPYSLMRAALYTNPSQEGIANSNFQPPLSADMDIFKNCAFYANTKQKQTLSLALISVESPSFGYLVDATVDTHTNFILDGITDTTDLRVGMRAVGTGIQANSVIVSIDSMTQVTISLATTASASVSVEFQDRFTLGDVDYWGGTIQDAATNTFLVDISSTPGQNINNTAINLVEIINTSTSNTTIYAYYISALDDLPGQMLFEERSIGGAIFTATSTAGSSFSPALPNGTPIVSNTMANPTIVTSIAHGLTSGDSITIYDSNSTPSIDGERIVTVLSADTFSIPVNVTVAGTTGNWIMTMSVISSNNDENQNRVYISKNSQVEAVPVYRFFNIGSANFPIQRVIALRDGIFFFKQDGIYRISGETFESFTVTLLDNTVVLKVPESAVAFNNQVFCFTTQGICAVTDTGVKIMSVPIETELLELASDQFTQFASASFGVAYESARLYMFFTITQESDTFATQAFIYNSLTDSWTQWIMDRTCGIVNTAVNKLFMAQGDTGQVLIERKNYTIRDYADEQYNVTITSVDSMTELTITSVVDTVIGMTIVQNGREQVISAINGLVLTVENTTGYNAGAAIVYTPIENFMRWSPITVENPGILKQFSEASFFFRDAAFAEIDISFGNNIADGFQTVAVQNKVTNGWGNFPWGQEPWGGSFGGQTVLRTYVPREYQRCSWLTVSLRTEQAFTAFSLQGASLIFNPMSSWIR